MRNLKNGVLRSNSFWRLGSCLENWGPQTVLTKLKNKKNRVLSGNLVRKTQTFWLKWSWWLIPSNVEHTMFPRNRINCSRSISWLLMSWLHVPGHQHSSACHFLPFKMNFIHLWWFDTEKWYQIQIQTRFVPVFKTNGRPVAPGDQKSGWTS